METWHGTVSVPHRKLLKFYSKYIYIYIYIYIKEERKERQSSISSLGGSHHDHTWHLCVKLVLDGQIISMSNVILTKITRQNRRVDKRSIS